MIVLLFSCDPASLNQRKEEFESIGATTVMASSLELALRAVEGCEYDAAVIGKSVKEEDRIFFSKVAKASKPKMLRVVVHGDEPVANPHDDTLLHANDPSKIAPLVKLLAVSRVTERMNEERKVHQAL